MPRRPPARSIPKPDWIFDRDVDWSELTAFVTHDVHDITMGVVSGRRRQGKGMRAAQSFAAPCEYAGGVPQTAHVGMNLVRRPRQVR